VQETQEVLETKTKQRRQTSEIIGNRDATKMLSTKKFTYTVTLCVATLYSQ
jgi:hypothetical protein